MDVLNNQISMFELLDCEETLPEVRQKFRRALRRGPNIEGGKERILKYAEQNKQDFIKSLKKEYGIGGSSFEDGWIDFDGKCFCITEKHFTFKRKYSWTEVANEILDLISTNSY